MEDSYDGCTVDVTDASFEFSVNDTLKGETEYSLDYIIACDSQTVVVHGEVEGENSVNVFRNDSG